MSEYELIHIDTLESVMCDKITIEGKDYYIIKTDELDMFTNYVDIIVVDWRDDNSFKIGDSVLFVLQQVEKIK